jgi:hypothetical protein
MIVGRPVPGRAFADVADQPLQQELWEGVIREVGRKEREAAFQETLDAIRPTWHALKAASDGGTPATLTLSHALIWAWGEGSGLHVPCVRVPLAAISTWWFGGGEVVKGAGGGFFFGGAAVVSE